MKSIFSLMLFLCVCLLVNAQEISYQLKTEVPYYEEELIAGDSYKKERCVLDIYYPENSSDFSTTVWFHGGGLVGGEKEIPERLKEQGICVIGVNYRLAPKVKTTECITDAAAAVAWALKNIAAYGGNPDLVFISGHSAGGYLASMVGLDKNYLEIFDVDANRIAGLIPFSGHTITHFTARKEIGIEGTQPLINNMAPLFHIRKDAPPLLLITGDREMEMLGRYEENAYMMRMMKVIGHKDTGIYEIDGYGHMMVEPALPLLIYEIRRIEKLRKEN